MAMEEKREMETYEGLIRCNSEAEDENGDDDGDGDDDDDDETLSLCDLPVILTKSADVEKSGKEGVTGGAQEDFDFHSWGGPERELDIMCSADEVFFHGQILPLHPSANSEFSFTCTNTEFSSTRSQNSSTSTTSLEKSKRIPSSRERNQFHNFSPSPKPQIRNCDIRERQSAVSQGRRSVSAWEFFRLGVVSAPEIGLKDLKTRHSISVSSSSVSVSRNSSSGGGSSSSSNKSFNSNRGSNTRNGRTTCSSPGGNDSKKSNHGFKQILGRNGGFFGGCKCTAETVQQNIVIIKNGSKNSDMISESGASAAHALEKDKVLEGKKQQQHKQKQKIKQAMSHRRTFEWLTGLSHVTNPNESLLIP